MNDQTIVAIYDTAAHADAAVQDLRADGVPADAISQHANESGMASASRTTATTTPSAPARDEGFWASLFGGHPDHDTAVYDRSIETGSTVVTVRAPDEHFNRVSAILEKHHPVDLDERSARYGATETTTRTTTTAGMGSTAASRDDTIQLAEENLSVGKRAVSGGTTRIRRYVVETPVEEQVSLHSEKVTMERRPVTDGRAVGTADFTERSIEMTETSEEAVVSKTARVTEEVSLHRQASDRVETIKDTVRRDDVKIEQVPGAETVRTGPAPVDPNRAKI